MVRHLLLLNFKASASSRNIEACMSAFVEAQETIEGIQHVEWGENTSREGLNKGFSHCVSMTFFDEGALNRYLPHPNHEALKAQLGPILEEILVFDYPL